MNCLQTNVPPPEQQLLQKVEQALVANDLKQAIAACRELNMRFPEFFDGWRIAGEIHALSGKPEAILFSTEKAESIRAGDLVISLQRIEAHIGLSDLAEARRLLLRIDNGAKASAPIHDRLGRHMASMDLHAEALTQYENAIYFEPGNASLLFNLATAQRFLGQTSEAIASLDKALLMDNNDCEAQAMRSSLAKQSEQSNHIVELEALLAGSEIGPTGQTSICYALAKEYDDIDQPQASFAHLERGARLRRGQMDYRVDSDIRVIDEIKRVYTEDFFADERDGDVSGEPIFIIGMPRTGTTLVERILSSHSAVYSAGELDNFGREMVRLVQPSKGEAVVDKFELVAQCAKLDFTQLGRAYVDSTRPMTDQQPRFIDKLPFNYLYAGLIHRALPNAKIVSLDRHPLATCYSVYKQLFRDPYPFSYDLEDLAYYFVAYRGLMEHWGEVMPGVIHSVQYEDVVDDVEKEARLLLEYCGLGWEDRCLKFYENQQASTTASAAQVRKPVYRSSLNRWQKYREHLKPAEIVLRKSGIDLSTTKVDL